MYVAVMLFIMGASSIVSIFNGEGVLEVIYCIFLAAAYIAFGVSVILIRKKMQA